MNELPENYFKDIGEEDIFRSVTRYNHNQIGIAGLKSPFMFKTFNDWVLNCLIKIKKNGDNNIFNKVDYSLRKYIQYKIRINKNV